jgi:hypothetical protein
MKIDYREFAGTVTTYPLASRRSKASVADFASPYVPGSGVGGLLQSLPAFLAAGDFRAIVEALVEAGASGRTCSRPGCRRC